MKSESPASKWKLIESGWIIPALLLLFLSFLPFLLPMADAVPALAKPQERSPRPHEHNRVVLIIIDGLGYNKAVSQGWMPHLQTRVRTSAFGKGLASFPTITPSGLRSILSGHQVGSQPELPTGMRASAEEDSVLARAVAAGLKAFAIGQFTWEPIFPHGHGAQLIVIPYTGISIHYDHEIKETINQYDQQVLNAAEPIISGQRGPWDFLVLHLFESDPIAHSIGTENSLYRNHLMWADRKIEELSRRLQEQAPTTFLLVADHGQAEDGSHGGLAKIEREVPFMLWGANIKPGTLGTIPLYNAAPTLSALLGIPPPTLTEGWPMVEAIQTTPRQKAAILMDLLQQRLGRWSAIRAAWPWLLGDPMPQIRQIKNLYEARKYAVAASTAELYIRAMDKAIAEALPEKWLWRLIAALWSLVFAACFGLAWHQAESKIGGLTTALGGVCILVLAFPLLRPNLWNWASAFVLLASVGILILSMIKGYKTDSGLNRLEWTFWWIFLFAISFQDLLDISLWSWLAVFALFISRAIHLTKANRLTSILSLLAVAACAALASGTRSWEVSLVRLSLPDIQWSLAAHADWRAIEILVTLFMLVTSYFLLIRWNAPKRSWTAYTSAMTPVALASILMLWKPSAAGWSWATCLLSLMGMTILRPTPDVRGVWLSALALAYYRTMADDKQWCFLALAVAVGWGLAWKSRDAHPMWEGLGFLGLGLWAYTLTGGSLTFSHVTVSEGYHVLGQGWHPYTLMTLLVLKTLTAFAAPILPRLASRPLNSLLGILPLLGAFSAGNLSMLWWDRFMAGATQRFTDYAGFTRTVFVLILAWIVIGLWTAIQGLDWLSEQLNKRSRAELGTIRLP